SMPSPNTTMAQFLDLVNTGNTFPGNLEVANGVVVYRGSVVSGQPSALGQSTVPIRVGNSATLVGTGTPSFAGNVTSELRLQAGNDTAAYTFTRDLDFSGASGSSAAIGRARFGIAGDGAGGLNVNVLTVSGTVTLAAGGRGTEFLPARGSQVLYFTGPIVAPAGTAGLVYWNPLGPNATSVDGVAAGICRFSDLARTYGNSQNLVNGVVIIEGSVGPVGAASPIGTQTLSLTDGNGGNITGATGAAIGVNPQDARRAVFLATPGAVFERPLAPGGGSTAASYNGGTFTVYNGYQFGGVNTNGTVTFSGLISCGNPNIGANPTNQIITLGQNIALLQAAGGTVDFTAGISDTPSSAHVARVTINQYRVHSQIDTNFDGLPDANANSLVGTPTTGTVLLSGTNTYEGTTEILGGTLRVPGSIQRSSALRLAAGTLVLPDNPLGLDRLSNAAPVTLGGATPASLVLEGNVTEIAGTLAVIGASPVTLDFGPGSGILLFADSRSLAWSSTLEIRNWSGDITGAGGLDQLVVGSDANGLSAAQIAQVRFINPNGFAPGSYGAVQLATGEVVPEGVRLDDIWVQGPAGTYAWEIGSNWASGVSFPNAVNSTANVTTNIDGAQTILVQQPITFGTLKLGDTLTPFYPFTLQSNGGRFTFDATTAPARLTRPNTNNPGVTDVLNLDVALADPLVTSLPWLNAGNGIQINGAVSGPGGLTLVSPAFPAAATTAGQLLDLTNPENSFTGAVEVANNVLLYRGNIRRSTNSALGNHPGPVRIGTAASLVGSGTPSYSSIPTMALRLQPSDDTANYVFERDLDFSGTSGSVAAMGRARFGIIGDGVGGTNLNTLLVSGNVFLTASNRSIEFHASRAGQTLHFTGDITAPAGASGNLLFGGGTSPGATSPDGAAGGSYRFSDRARNFPNPIQLTIGTAIIDGSVGPVGSPSPIGTQVISTSDGNGGNIISVNAQEARRSIFLTQPGSGYARLITLGDGSTSAGYNGGSFRVYNGYQLGGRNTSGTVTFSGGIACNNPSTGANPTNQVITLGYNLALLAETGGTAEFSGPITDTASTTNHLRLTINQFRNHSQIDANTDGIPDAGVANALVDVPLGGTVILSGTNAYEGGTEVLGGTLLVNTPGASGTGPGPVLVAAGATLGGAGAIGGSVTFQEGARAVFTQGATLAIGGALVLSNNVTVRLNLASNLTAGSYTLATYNPTGSSGSFAATPVIDTGSLAPGLAATILTGGGNVVLQVAPG
ncbi:MAG: hypothetical protein RJA22_3357, partial [Verrucomicrobiota bacterium]